MDALRTPPPANRLLLTALVAAVFLGPLGGPDQAAVVEHPPGPEGITVRGATPGDLRLIGYAVGRYRRAGLRLPQLDISFHQDQTECHGRQGFESNAHVDLCVGTLVNLWSEKIVLHELAHTWCEANLSAAKRVPVGSIHASAIAPPLRRCGNERPSHAPHR